MTLILLALTALGKAPAVEAIPLPDASDEWSVGPSDPVSDAPWWDSFEDPTLDKLVRSAIDDNFDVQAAFARVAQADAFYLQQMSTVLPSLTFDNSTSLAPTDALGFGFGGGLPIGGGKDVYVSGSANFNARWTLDIFGRDSLRTIASKFEKEALEGDAQAAALSVSTRIANAWYDLVAAEERVRLLEGQIDANTRLLELTDMRASKADGTAVDVLQQRQQVAASEAQLPTAQLQADIARQTLAILIGRSPSDPLSDMLPGEPDPLPTLPPKPGIGKPADLMETRPDLRAQVARLDSATRKATASALDFLPSLSINASAGWQYNDVSETEGFQDLFLWSTGAQVSVPIFDMRTIGGVKEAHAARNIAADQLSSSILLALQEVEQQLTSETRQQTQLDALERQAIAARDALSAAADRYASGLLTYINVLAAINASQAADLSLLQAQRDVLTTRIRLHETLGGTWTESLEPDGAAQ